MITRTSFNKRFLQNIDEALRAAAYNSRMWSAAAGCSCKGMAYVMNARKKVMLRVDHNRGEPQAFQFYDNRQRNVTELVLAALRAS